VDTQISYNTPDISNIVQEIVNRAGWNLNNAMGFLIPNNGSVDNFHIFYSVNFAPAKPTAHLVVNYTDGGSAHDIIVTAQSRSITNGGDID